MAGKEYTGKDKKVSKMTREGLVEENLHDGTVKDISHKSRGRPQDQTAEFVPERERKKKDAKPDEKKFGQRPQKEQIRKSSLKEKSVEKEGTESKDL